MATLWLILPQIRFLHTPFLLYFDIARYARGSNPTYTMHFASPTYRIDGVKAGNATCNCRKAHLDYMVAISRLGDESNAECSTTTTTKKPKTFLSLQKPCRNTRKCNNNAKNNRCNTQANCERGRWANFCKVNCKNHCYSKGSTNTGCYKVLYENWAECA